MPFYFKRLSIAAATVAVVAGGLTACTPELDTRGDYPSQQLISKIKVGTATRNEVQQDLGSPSTVGTFDKNTWYYIGEKTKTVAFFDPDLLKRQILIFNFDDTGHVKSLVRRDASDGRTVALVERETPTRGRELGILEQLIGNIGRFSGNDNQ